MAAAATAPAPVEVVRVRLVDLRPPPRLRALTWASAEWACALLRLPDGAPLTLARALAGGGRAAAPVDPEAFVLAACAEGDAGARNALRVYPADLIAGNVLAAFVEALAEAEAEAAAYGAVRRASVPPEPYGEAYDRWRTAGGSDGLPVPFAAAVTSQGPEAWAVLEDWPLARTLRYMEDVAVQAFFRELEEINREAAREGAKHHG